MNRPERIGIFGGTFDPIHNAHIEVAHTALKEAHLDRLLFVVSARPPHKSEGPFATAEQRAELVGAAIAGESRMEVCRIEMDRQGPSYTVDTLRTLRQRYPAAQFFLIVGSDALTDLPRWKDAAEILRLARLLVIPRPGEWEVAPMLHGHFSVLPFRESAISSTEVRERVQADRPVDDLVPESVRQVILKRGLYDVCSSKRGS